jgi:uncharacterized protein
VLGGLGAALAAGLVSIGLERLGWPAPAHPVEILLERATGFRDLFVVVVAVTGPVAVGEEVFFRGFAYRLLRARFGVALAIGLTAMGFALAHGLEVSAWLPVLPVGIVLGALAERSGSLGPPIVGHAVVNVVAVLTG